MDGLKSEYCTMADGVNRIMHLFFNQVNFNSTNQWRILSLRKFRKTALHGPTRLTGAIKTNIIVVQR